MFIDISLYNVENYSSSMLKNYITGSTKNGYHLIKYKRNKLIPQEYHTLGKLRSLVLNSNNRMFMYSPPKSIDNHKLHEILPTAKQIIIQEYAEGIMINVAFDSDANQWIIATHSIIGANTHFYNNGTYPVMNMCDMFTEACERHNLTYNILNPSFSYSFVMQHPKHRIVLPCKEPTLTLVAMYSISDNKIQVMNLNEYPLPPECTVRRIYEYDHMLSNEINSNIDIRTPESIVVSMSHMLERYITKTWNSRPGIMFSIEDEHGHYFRYRIRNMEYQRIHELRGNNWKLEYQFLELAKTDRIPLYLEYFPEDNLEFSKYNIIVQCFIQILHIYYQKVHIHREIPLSKVPVKFRNHVFNLHKIYLESLETIKYRTTYKKVSEYVKSIDSAKLLYSLNYNSYNDCVPIAHQLQCRWLEFYILQSIGILDVTNYSDTSLYFQTNYLCEKVRFIDYIRQLTSYNRLVYVKKDISLQEIPMSFQPILEKLHNRSEKIELCVEDVMGYIFTLDHWTNANIMTNMCLSQKLISDLHI